MKGPFLQDENQIQYDKSKEKIKFVFVPEQKLLVDGDLITVQAVFNYWLFHIITHSNSVSYTYLIGCPGLSVRPVKVIPDVPPLDFQ